MMELNTMLYKPSAPVAVVSAVAVGCEQEKNGPMGNEFDFCFPDEGLSCSSWEKAEKKLLHEAIRRVCEKHGIAEKDISVLFAGDLLSQCISSAFCAGQIQVPFAGLYGACSTFVLGMALGSVFAGEKIAQRVCVASVSHFCGAEKQFRMPLEYGNQRTPTAQRTATASGALIIESTKGECMIESCMLGRVIDEGVTDANNMGAAMAPAAADTIASFLHNTKTVPEDYSMICTGDLGAVGSELLIHLLERKYCISIAHNHADCGKMLYYTKEQDVHAGASGAGCSAAVFGARIRKQIADGELEKVLFVGTGALLSPISVQQTESIPGIAHAVCMRHG